MIRISLSFFYSLGATLRPVAAINQNSRLNDVFGLLLSAENELKLLQQAAWFAPAMKAGAAPLARLIAALQAVTTQTDFTKFLHPNEIFNITSALADFETVLKTELSISDTYFVTRKAAYDTTALILNAESCFPVELALKVPLAIFEVREAGRCLAFELNTAAGFHVLRATETVLRAYWDAVTNNAKPPFIKTISRYVKQLGRREVGEEKVRASLKQIGDLHRNPLMHPEDTLNQEDAIALMGICNSAIGAMLKEIPQPAPVIAPNPAPPPPPL